MNLQHWVYATTKDCRDRARTVSAMRAVAERLKEIGAVERGLSWTVVPVVEDADYDDFEVDRDEVQPVTGGRLPFLFLSLSYDLERTQPGWPEIEAMLAEHGFQHLLTEPEDAASG